jgi:hypothetical protein
LLTILAASDEGLFRSEASDVKNAAKSYQDHIERLALRPDQIGQGRVYSDGFKQVAEVFYSGVIRLSARAQMDRAKAALVNRKVRREMNRK